MAIAKYFQQRSCELHNALELKRSKLKGFKMSIIINLYYSGKNGDARKFVKEMESSGIAAQIRNESGNLRYEYFCPLKDPETVLLIDCWQSQAALDAHHASPTMAKILDLREKYDLHMKVERYLSDDDGVPDADKQFIRE